MTGHSSIFMISEHQAQACDVDVIHHEYGVVDPCKLRDMNHDG
jgi:hypothetical protein